jgi:hypothetical protein
MFPNELLFAIEKDDHYYIIHCINIITSHGLTSIQFILISLFNQLFNHIAP